MKFIKVITKHTSEELDIILNGLDSFSFEFMLSLYESFRYVEIDLPNGHNVLFAAIEDNQIEKLMSEFVKNEIDFTYEDITKLILYGETLKIEDEEKLKTLNIIIDEFIENNLDTDFVLEKLHELKDVKYLNQRDLKVLENH